MLTRSTLALNYFIGFKIAFPSLPLNFYSSFLSNSPPSDQPFNNISASAWPTSPYHARHAHVINVFSPLANCNIPPPPLPTWKIPNHTERESREREREFPFHFASLFSLTFVYIIYIHTWIVSIVGCVYKESDTRKGSVGEKKKFVCVFCEFQWIWFLERESEEERREKERKREKREKERRWEGVGLSLRG